MTYQELLANALESGELGRTVAELETQRQQMRHNNRTVIIILTVITAAVMVMFHIRQMGTFPCLLAALVAVIIGLIITRRNTCNLIGDYKGQVIPRLLAIALPGFDYCGNDYIEEELFTDCGLFISPDRFNGKDYFCGRRDKTNLRFSLVHAEERYETTTTDTDKDGHTTTRTEENWRDIFKGLFLVADFNKYFNGYTLVRDGKAGILSGFSRNLVKLEDPEFNRQFQVYASNQIEARYILTPRMMERLLDLKKQFGHSEFAFTGSCVHIALAGVPYAVFDPHANRPCTDQGQLENILAWVLAIVGIVDDLDLNTRIWTKK